MEERTPLGRIGEPEDPVRLAVFLASNMSSDVVSRLSINDITEPKRLMNQDWRASARRWRAFRQLAVGVGRAKGCPWCGICTVDRRR